MEFLTNLFKKNKKDHDSVYDSQLICQFYNEHKKLIDQVYMIKQEIDSSEVRNDKIKILLHKLKQEISDHFIEEDAKLYAYLEDYYKQDESNLQTIKEFEDSFHKVQGDLMYFFDRYCKDEIKLDKEFIESFRDFIEKLSLRVYLEEEKLYPLYLKLNRVQDEI